MTKQQYESMKNLITHIYFAIEDIMQTHRIAELHDDEEIQISCETKIEEKTQQVSDLWFVVTGHHSNYMTIIKKLGLYKKGT